MDKIRAFIVDDEPPARRRVAELLELSSEVEVVGELDNGADAVEALRRQPADLLFLDIQMPGLDGFGVLESLGPTRAPVTVFVTAFDRYALKAFDVHALDYLLKPFSDERFHAALGRACAMVRSRDRGALDDKLDALLADVTTRPSSFLKRVVVKNAGRVSFVDVNEIDWIEATGVYVTIHTASKDHLIRETLASFETKLDPECFARIHRSAIVSLSRVAEIRSDVRGHQHVVLDSGASIKLSRAYRERLERSMEGGAS